MVKNENALSEREIACQKEAARIAALLDDEMMPWIQDREREYCSGFGGYHSNEPGAEARRPYAMITLPEIRAMVDNPPSFIKDEGRWFIPSSLPSRNFARQAEEGAYRMLWSDIDLPPDSFAACMTKIEASILKGVDFEAYTSRSATLETQKFHILIPLRVSVTGEDWSLLQATLCRMLMGIGIKPDTAAIRSAQLCYLPNRGAYYESQSRRGVALLDPVSGWAEQVAHTVRAAARAYREEEESRQQRKAQREALRAARGPYDGPNVIAEFKARYSVEGVLEEAGYARKGDDFRHPGSESGSYSCNVKDGVAFSLSPNDPLWTGGAGGKAHDSFSAFTVLQHDGDSRKAFKAAAEMMGVGK